MKLVKKSITIPEELILLSNKVSDNFSAFVTKALEEYLKKENIITFTSIDCMILASAIINGHKIVTRNSKYYPLKAYLLKF